MWPLDQDRPAAGALDQGARRAGIAGTLDKVAFLVAWKLTALRLGRSHVETDHVWDPAPPVLALAA